MGYPKFRVIFFQEKNRVAVFNTEFYLPELLDPNVSSNLNAHTYQQATNELFVVISKPIQMSSRIKFELHKVESWIVGMIRV